MSFKSASDSFTTALRLLETKEPSNEAMQRMAEGLRDMADGLQDLERKVKDIESNVLSQL